MQQPIPSGKNSMQRPKGATVLRQPGATVQAGSPKLAQKSPLQPAPPQYLASKYAEPPQRAADAPAAKPFSQSRRWVLWSVIAVVSLAIAIAGLAYRNSQRPSAPATASVPATDPAAAASVASLAGADEDRNAEVAPAGTPATPAPDKPSPYAAMSDKEYWLKRVVPHVAESAFYTKLSLAPRPYTESLYPSAFKSDGVGCLDTKPLLSYRCEDMSAERIMRLKTQIAVLEKDPKNLDALERAAYCVRGSSSSRLVPYMKRFEKAGGVCEDSNHYQWFIVGLYQMGLDADAAAALKVAEKRWPGFSRTSEMGQIVYERFTLHFFHTGDVKAMVECLEILQGLDNDEGYYAAYKRMVAALKPMRTDRSWSRYQKVLDPMWIYLPYDHVQDAVRFMKMSSATPTPVMLAAADPDNKGLPAPATALLHRAEYAFCTDTNTELALQIARHAAKEAEGRDWDRWYLAQAELLRYLRAYGRLEDAQVIVDKLLAMSPQHPQYTAIAFLQQVYNADAFCDYARAHEFLEKARAALAPSGQWGEDQVSVEAQLLLHEGRAAAVEEFLIDYAESVEERHAMQLMSRAHLMAGECLLAQGKFKPAIVELQAVLSSVMQQAGADYPINIQIQVQSQVELAYAFMGDKNFSQAQEFLDRAMDISKRGQSPELWWTWQAAKASIALAVKNLPEAQQAADEALQSVELQRANLRDYHNRSSLFNNKAKAFQVAMEVALAKNDPAAAFRIAEQARARGFLDELGSHAATTQRKPPAPVDLPAFQKVCNGFAAVCFYQMGTEVLAWVVHNNRSDLVRLTVTPKQLADLSGAFFAALEREGLNLEKMPPQLAEQLKKEPKTEVVAKQLYDALWKPVEAKLTAGERVCILPHLRLHYLPFQAFHDGKEFLLEKHELFYVPSASALVALTGQTVPPNDAVLLLENAQVADVNSPFHVTETAALQKLYPKAASFDHAGSTVKVFEEQAPKAGVIHLSCHGYFDAAVPLNSGLALGDVTRDVASLLSARKVYGMRFDKTQMIVMSACVSSKGGLSGGDDVTGITRAFQAAGIPNVVGSLWPVENAATTKLMTTFHQELQTTPADPVKALCTAQRQQIRSNAKIGQWSGFELNGTGRIAVKTK